MFKTPYRNFFLQFSAFNKNYTRGSKIRFGSDYFVDIPMKLNRFYTHVKGIVFKENLIPKF